MDLEYLRGWALTSVVLHTDLNPSEARIVLRTESEGTTLVLSQVVHARIDLSGPDSDFVDQVIAVKLPKAGPWPQEARHLLHHHNNTDRLWWLRLLGPSELEIVAQTLGVE